ncbi:lipoyl(octanoyl) transferase LipB [Halothiobacillus sp. DCM-1]|uniref:lipoyl(octanoyl) transferase LipB n=1 Tax=Halothiobacillus sp. DCM-1 TaxID=3112558 RepID=UPI00324E0A61
MSKCACEHGAALALRLLGVDVPYLPVLQAMRAFTAARMADTPDELWVLQHAAVFTQGLNGQAAHVLDAGVIPVVPTDRGGQVTYHGSGQIVLYPLIDLARAGLGVRGMVELLEQAVLDMLADWGVPAHRRSGAPGVYVAAGKIAALGLKVRQGRCYHGVACNLAMDLAPFSRINPCGYAGLAVTDCRQILADRWQPGWVEAMTQALIAHLARLLGRSLQLNPAPSPFLTAVGISTQSQPSGSV